MAMYRTGAKSSILQAIGVDQATAEGAIKKLKLSSDNEWTQIWTSDRVVAKESGVNIPEKCTVEYKFSESIAIKIEVVDERTEENVGVYMTYLSEIVSEGQQVVFLEEKTNGVWAPSNGVLIIGSQENRQGFDDEVAFELVGKNFPKRTSKLPFIIISKLVKVNGKEQWNQVDKTFMMGFKNPDKPEFWPLSLRISEITQKNQKELQLKFVCKLRDYDDPEQKHKYLGEFQATYQELQVGKEFSCEPPESPEDNNTNIVIVKSRKTLPTFLEIIPSLDIRASISIDFTASNKQGKRYGSKPFGMHEVEQDGEFNYYEQAILSVISIVEHYDRDKEMPVMGFGATIKATRKTDHCFALRPMMGPDADGQPRDENCIGTLGVLEAYRYVVINKLISLNGPTVYQPSVELVRKQACAHKGLNDAFYLLVILTDGDYADESETKAEIAMASQCPMSIILVGIGDDAFKKLEDLDNDDGIPLQGVDRRGVRHEAVADIVQLVKYKDFIGRLNTPGAMRALKDAVLEEFPMHVQNYFKMYNLRPKPHNGPIRSFNVEPKPITVSNMNELERRFGYQDA